MAVSLSGRRRQVLSGAAVLLALLLGYMLIWWNRGIQLNSNGMPTLAADYILSGKLPYRDFHFWCPPGHLLVYTALSALFGDALIYVRAFAVVERLAIFLVVYFWLTRLFSARAAFFGTAAAAVGFSSDIGDVIAHYNFDAILAAVLAGLAASVAVSSPNRRVAWLYLATGFCAGSCCIAKQTLGVGVSLLFPVIFFFADPRARLTSRLRAASVYIAGWLVPVAAMAFWLWRGGALDAFLSQTLLQGTSSKGSPAAILFRPFLTLAESKMLLAAFCLAATALMFFVPRLLSGLRRDASEERSGSLLMWAAALALAAGLACSFLPLITVESRLLQKLLTGFSACAIFFTLLASGLLALAYTVRGLAGRLDSQGAQAWIFASLSFTTAYMFSLSWAAFEPMLVPGFAFLTALLIDAGSARKRTWRPALAIVAAGCALIASATVRKMIWPYGWENWSDGPVRTETAAVNFPEMNGLRVTPEAAAFIENVTALIDEHSRPADTILCYPNFALFYVLAHRAPATFAFMHWFDIAPDALCRQDSERIRRNLPAVILFSELPEKDIRRLEVSFRGGRTSGQREFIGVIQSLPGYRMLSSLPIPGVDCTLKIYVRD